MTERKPPGVSFESWVERQIRLTQQRGEFDNLAGAGKPLPQGPKDRLDWFARKLERENVDGSALLPPSLAVAKEIEELPARLSRERSEARVRELVAHLNERIRRVHRGPQVGPPLRARPIDVEEAVLAWRERRKA